MKTMTTTEHPPWMHKQARGILTRALICAVVIFATLAWGIYGGPSR